MRKTLKAVMLAVFALVSICASAQESINVGGLELRKGMNHQQVVEWFEGSSQQDVLFVLERTETSSAGAKKYFVTKYFWREGKKKVMDMTLTETPIKTNSEGYVKTTTNQMTSSQKESFLKGESEGYDPEHRNRKGEKRHTFGVAALGGGVLTSDGKLNPSVALRLFYETCNFAFSVEGVYSTADHTQTSSVGGKYSTFQATGNVVWKFLQNQDKDAYLGVGLKAGYGYQKTDKDENSLLFSENFGFTGGAFLEGSISLGKHVKIMGDLGYQWFPNEVTHDGGDQSWSCQGFYGQFGLVYTFDLK
jgi:hypothetical protein